jgi:hypothetical protein
MQRLLIVAGLVLLVLGLLWPWLARSRFWHWIGRLPGDIHIEREGFSVYFPLTTGLIVSLVLTLILWWLRR